MSTPRRIFRALTFVVAGLTMWMAYANVLSDDAPVRAQAGAAARAAAGCGDACKVLGLRGDRGMFSETIHFDIDRKGTIVVTCRRAYVAFGDYACTAERP